MKLETKGITYSIDGKLIIDGIDISVKEGEFVGIVGPNGCGKSTLLKNIYKVYTPDIIVVQLSRQKSKHFIMN